MRAHIAVGHRGAREHGARVPDPYLPAEKLSEPAVCIGCGAVYQKGRWHWALKAPKGAGRETCQACRRIEDDFPAGAVTLRGAWVRAHLREVLALARGQEHAEMKDHPLRRIMSVDDRRNSVVIRTTDLELPARIGRALARAWKGELDLRRDENAYFLSVSWRREA